jgi:hypothetical protein
MLPSLQLTVGTHRVWVTEAVALMVEAGNTVVDGCVAAAKLIPRVLHLAVYRPLSSALHYRCVVACLSKQTTHYHMLLQLVWLQASFQGGGG